ncbi:hypothetical protein D8674_013294 [Pyrus ussuriensis x Pyrus communis]|uniref:Uncharacterized protein n=1 Tax=Pyrus ussuriensis x Pyrus communis TaxID=2448454 RepID=A0A5N5GPC2_9ROSA|nr:hypothetical protein D8674_013294 [Pyrus ussuriensis x Pyrus communis]
MLPSSQCQSSRRPSGTRCNVRPCYGKDLPQCHEDYTINTTTPTLSLHCFLRALSDSERQQLLRLKH